MTFTTKMTQKGQVTIPKYVRDRLDVGRDSEFIITFDERLKEVKFRPMMTLEELAGSLKSDISLTDEELRAARDRFATEWAQE